MKRTALSALAVIFCMYGAGVSASGHGHDAQQRNFTTTASPKQDHHAGQHQRDMTMRDRHGDKHQDTRGGRGADERFSETRAGSIQYSSAFGDKTQARVSGGVEGHDRLSIGGDHRGASIEGSFFSRDAAKSSGRGFSEAGGASLGELRLGVARDGRGSAFIGDVREESAAFGGRSHTAGGGLLSGGAWTGSTSADGMADHFGSSSGREAHSGGMSAIEGFVEQMRSAGRR